MIYLQGQYNFPLLNQLLAVTPALVKNPDIKPSTCIVLIVCPGPAIITGG
jgi:hypothetical protein